MLIVFPTSSNVICLLLLTSARRVTDHTYHIKGPFPNFCKLPKVLVAVSGSFFSLRATKSPALL